MTTTPVIDSLTIGLIAYYPFNNSANDSTIYANNGTAFNLTSIPDRHGKANAAYHFDGSTSYIEVPDYNNILTLGGISFTLNAWVKLDSYNDSYATAIMSKRGDVDDGAWAWFITGEATSPTGVVFFDLDDSNPPAVGITVVGLNSWHMVTSEYDFTTKKISIYIDGTLDKSLSIGSPLIALNHPLYIGKDNEDFQEPSYFFQGAIDDIRIYNRKLSIDDIHKLLID